MKENHQERGLSLRSLFDLPFLSGENLWKGDQSGLSLSEDKEHIFVEAHLPGLNPDDIELIFEKGELWITGEKREEEGDKNKKYYRKASTSFSYHIDIPSNVDEKKEPEATYKDGVMKIAFSKIQGEENERKRIKVKKG